MEEGIKRLQIISMNKDQVWTKGLILHYIARFQPSGKYQYITMPSIFFSKFIDFYVLF